MAKVITRPDLRCAYCGLPLPDAGAHVLPIDHGLLMGWAHSCAIADAALRDWHLSRTDDTASLRDAVMQRGPGRVAQTRLFVDERIQGGS